MNDKKAKKNTIIAVIIFAIIILGLTIFLISHSDIMEGKIKPLELPFNVRPLIDPETATISDDSRQQIRGKYGEILSDTFIKGIYVDPNTLSVEESRQKMIRFAKENGINAFLFDIRDEDGKILYPSLVEEAKRRSNEKIIYPNLSSIITELEEAGIIPMARICMLKDMKIGETSPEWVIKNEKGLPFKDRTGHYWIDPSSAGASAYLSSFIKEAVLLGFSEILLDVLRYPTEGQNITLQVPKNENQRVKFIGDFINHLKKETSEYSYRLSIVTSGRVTSMTGERGTGQRLDMLYETVDIFSPMIFPSNYYGGELGIKYPYAEPYRVLKESLSNALDELSLIEDEASKKEFQFRPILQAFSSPWLKQSYKDKYFEYEENEVLEQIRALQECGIQEWILWNSKSDYPNFENLR